MHTYRDAQIFVESLNCDQRRALANALFLEPRNADLAPTRSNEREMRLIASRLCEVIQMVRTMRTIVQWEPIVGE